MLLDILCGAYQGVMKSQEESDKQYMCEEKEEEKVDNRKPEKLVVLGTKTYCPDCHLPTAGNKCKHCGQPLDWSGFSRK